MPVIKPTCLRDLKFRVNIADVVSRTVALKRAGGSRFKGLCPFHNEKTPSFHVDSDKGFYKCFGCGKAGDIISFVRETEQLDFTEAVETLGKRFGVPIEYEENTGAPTREERSLRQELFDLHETATDHYHEIFKQTTPGSAGEWMQAYWQNTRRFTPELADEFKIGAAPPDGNALYARLHKARHTEDAIRRSGLFFTNENAPLTLHNVRPRFRGRLMIPIRDHQGRVVAFTARQTDLTPADDPAHEAKYVNSPETPIFTKGNLIFNLDRARAAVAPAAPFVLVEGQLDALRCWSVGIKTAIAFQGTAITEAQLALLHRYHTQVECLFDGDAAGQKAALRYLPLALKAGIETRFLALADTDPSAKKIDPDDLFRERGPAAYDELRRHALTAMQFACRAHLPDPEHASAEQKTNAARQLFDIILNSESEVIRSQFIREIATHLRLPPEAITAVQQDFARRKRTTHATASTTAPATTSGAAAPTRNEELETRNPGAESAEHHLLLLCLHNEPLAPAIAHLILDTGWIDDTHVAGALLKKTLNHFASDDWPGRDHLDEHGILETDAEKTLAATLLFDPPKTDDPRRAIDQTLTALRNRALTTALRQIELALANLPPDSVAEQTTLIKQRIELQRQLRQPFGLPAAA